jgi:hypothetical protein
MVRLAALVGLVLLGGCARETTREDIQAGIDRMAAQEDQACRSYGAAPGTQAYMQCRLQRDQNRALIVQGLPSPMLR